MFAEKLVLGFHEAGDSAHEDSAFTREIAQNFLFKSGFKQITGADGDSEGDGKITSAPSGVLKNREAGIYPTAIQKIITNGFA